MKKLIITADDYGMSHSVNEAIEAGVEAGVITATNLMVGMPYCSGISELKQKYPNISIGLHWTLSAGNPVSDKSEIPSLVDSDGVFWSYSEFRRRFRKNMISIEEIKRELGAQYHRYIDICGEPDYWNTHHNIHVDFKIFEVFLDMASKFKICKMRNNQRVYVPARGKKTLSTTGRILEPLKRILLKHWLSNAIRKSISSPEGLITLLSEEDKFDLEYAFSNIEWGNKTIAEMIIHPATSKDSVYFGKITDKRIREFNLFRDPLVSEIAKKNGILLCGFEEVK